MTSWLNLAQIPPPSLSNSVQFIPTVGQLKGTKSRSPAFLPRDAILKRYTLPLCVRLSVTSRYCIKTNRRTELVFVSETSFDGDPKLHYYKQNRVPPKIRVLPSGTLPQTLDRKNSPRQKVDGVVNKTRRRSSLWITRTTIERVVAECASLLYTGRLQPSNSTTSTWSKCTTVVPCAAVGEILTASSRRAVRLRLQSFLLASVFTV